MAENLRRFDFTMARLAALKPAKPGKRDRYWDEKVKGLTLRVTDRGAKAYYVTRWVGTRSEEIRLGAFPDLIVEAARDLAQAAIVSQVRGEDLGERKRALRGEPTFKELFDWWKVLPTKRGRKSASYIKDATWQFETYLEMWGGRKASHIKRTDVRDLHSKIGAKHPYQANRVLATVRAVYNRAIEHEKIAGPNPALGTKAFDEVSRERRLLPGEASRFINAVVSYPNTNARDFVLLSLFSGARRANVQAMRWEDIDLEGRTWRIPVTKGGRPQSVPLEDAEIEILERRLAARKPGNPWVFPSYGTSGHIVEPKTAWKSMLKAAGIKDLRVHDLRRSLASFMADEGAGNNVIGHALNHLSPAATAIYSRIALGPVRLAKRRALAAMREV